MHQIKYTALLLAALVLFFACSSKKSDQSEKARKEITQAEKDFEQMAADKGIAEAFWFFADSNAVIKRRNDSLIRGKDNIRNFYSADFFKTASVKWSPDFVEASGNGDIGYTYGHYLWQSRDSSGKLEENKGIFHTVWKKQADGSWKYVWD